MAEAQDSAVVLELLKPLAVFLNDCSLYEIIVNHPGQVLTEGPGGWQIHDLSGLSFENSCAFPGRWQAFPIKPSMKRDRYFRQHFQMASEFKLSFHRPPRRERSASQFGSHHRLILRLMIWTPMAFSLRRKQASVPFQKSKNVYKNSTKRAIQGVSSSSCYRAEKYYYLWRDGICKTTLSKALIKHIPQHERVISIEDSPELIISQPNQVRLFYSKGSQGLSNAGPKELLESCLRMRPDRILLQELRDGSAFYYIRNINSGHPGSITTVHADSARLAFEQLTLLVKESEGEAHSNALTSDVCWRFRLTLLCNVNAPMERSALLKFTSPAVRTIEHNWWRNNDFSAFSSSQFEPLPR